MITIGVWALVGVVGTCAWALFRIVAAVGHQDDPEGMDILRNIQQQQAEVIRMRKEWEADAKRHALVCEKRYAERVATDGPVS